MTSITGRIDHAKAIIELTMKTTTPKQRQEIINGAFLRAPESGGLEPSSYVGHKNMIAPLELKKNWRALGFLEGEEADFVVEITPTRVEQLGHTQHVHFELSGEKSLAILDPDDKIIVGETIELKIPTEKMHIFDGATEERLT